MGRFYQTKTRGARFYEMDAIRGVAILMMITYHFMFNLWFFFNMDVDISGFWHYFQQTTAFLFIFLVGVSLHLSFSRAQAKSRKAGYMKYLKRGIRILAYGMLVTLTTWIFLRSEFVVFGVLHCIGLSIMLAYPFLKLKGWNFAIGAGLIALGNHIAGINTESNSLLMFGVRSAGFHSIDYFPMLPWFGVVLLGIGAGSLLYKNNRRGFKIPELSGIGTVESLCYLGRHSLLIYLIHQPLIVGVMFAAASII